MDAGVKYNKQVLFKYSSYAVFKLGSIEQIHFKKRISETYSLGSYEINLLTYWKNIQQHIFMYDFQPILPLDIIKLNKIDTDCNLS